MQMIWGSILTSDFKMASRKLTMFDYRSIKGSYCVTGFILFVGITWLCGSGCGPTPHTISAALPDLATFEQINAWNSSSESAVIPPGELFAQIQVTNCGNT